MRDPMPQPRKSQIEPPEHETTNWLLWLVLSYGVSWTLVVVYLLYGDML